MVFADTTSPTPITASKDTSISSDSNKSNNSDSLLNFVLTGTSATIDNSTVEKTDVKSTQVQAAAWDLHNLTAEVVTTRDSVAVKGLLKFTQIGPDDIDRVVGTNNVYRINSLGMQQLVGSVSFDEYNIKSGMPRTMGSYYYGCPTGTVVKFVITLTVYENEVRSFQTVSETITK